MVSAVNDRRVLLRELLDRGLVSEPSESDPEFCRLATIVSSVEVTVGDGEAVTAIEQRSSGISGKLEELPLTACGSSYMAISSIASSSDPRVRKTSFSSLPAAERRREEDRMRYRDDDWRREDERRREEDRRYDDRRRDWEEDKRREEERRRKDDWSRERRSRSRSHSSRPRDVPEVDQRKIWMERIK